MSTVNIKSEPVDASPNVIHLSSDEDDITLPIHNKMTQIKHPDRPGTPETHCSICLEELSNRCYTDSCWHMFCYSCLKQWSLIESSCPLCKKSFKKIHHTFNNLGTHDTYNIEQPISERELSPRVFLRPFSRITFMNTTNLFLDVIQGNGQINMNNVLRTADQNHNVNFNNITLYSNINLPLGYDFHHPLGNEMRRRVYTENIWSESLPDISGRFRECGPNYFRNNTAQTFRLFGFIVRDINVIRTIQTTLLSSYNLLAIEYSSMSTSAEVIANMIMQLVSSHEITGLYMITMLRPYLGEYTIQFCHELYNFANSPYDLIGYDRNVCYTSRFDIFPPFLQVDTNRDPREIPTVPLGRGPLYPFLESNTIVLDSDSDEFDTRPEVIVVSSSDDSDIEIIGHTFHPMSVFDLTNNDEPSTSTGIQNSSRQRNIRRYNLRRQRQFSSNLNNSNSRSVHVSRVSYPPGLRRGRITVDSSSNDESSITPARRRSQTVHVKTKVVYGRKNTKTKRNKKKLRKRKRTDESRSQVHFGSRNRTYSVSSSSSDSRSINNCVSIRTDIVL